MILLYDSYDMTHIVLYKPYDMKNISGKNQSYAFDL